MRAPEDLSPVPDTISLGAGLRVNYPTTTDSGVRNVMRANRRRDTKPEIALRSALHRRGFRFRKDALVRTRERTVRVDVALPRHRVVVLVDGCFWHCCPQHGTQPRTNQSYWHPKLERNVARDQVTNQLLQAAGWRVIRIWEHEDPDEAAGSIDQAVRCGA